MEIFDNVLTPEENLKFHRELLFNKRFRYGEKDTYGMQPTGMTYDFSDDDEIFLRLNSIVLEKFPEMAGKELRRKMVNLFQPHERPFYHNDGDVWTFLFYIVPPVSPDEGGETQFYIDDKTTYSCSPKPGRMVKFDGRTLHKAITFRTIPRLTAVIKYRI